MRISDGVELLQIFHSGCCAPRADFEPPYPGSENRQRLHCAQVRHVDVLARETISDASSFYRLDEVLSER
jgi:hypothetical protein